MKMYLSSPTHGSTVVFPVDPCGTEVALYHESWFVPPHAVLLELPSDQERLSKLAGRTVRVLVDGRIGWVYRSALREVSP